MEVKTMKKSLYVILEDCSQDLGEGYSSWSGDQFLGIVANFETARNIIEYLTDLNIGEENPGYKYCDDCSKGFCGGCQYQEHAIVTDEDWNRISLEADDIYGSNIDFHFVKVEVEV